MTKAFRFLHVLGLILFPGSILGIIVVSELANPGGDFVRLAYSREVIVWMTRLLTLPGMALVVASGIGLARREGHGFLRPGWLAAKQAIALVVVINAVVVLWPGTETLFRLGRESMTANTLHPDFMATLWRETVFGTINVILILAAIALGVWQPRRRR